MNGRTNDSLPEEVGLPSSNVRTRKLPINFILDVAHRDEGCDNTIPATSLDCIVQASLYDKEATSEQRDPRVESREDARRAVMVP